MYTGHLETLLLCPLVLLDFLRPNGSHGHNDKGFTFTSLRHDHLGREYGKSGPFREIPG